MADEARRWTIKTARTVYDNKWISVREYAAVAPTGAPALYGLVHPKNLAIGVVPIDDDGRTVLVGQDRFCFGRYSWELPEGGGDEHRPPIEAAQRELAEEVGIRAAGWSPLLADVHLSNSITDERAYAYLCWDFAPADAAHADDVEDIAVRWLPFAEAVAMAVDGAITDAFTLVMLLKTDHLARTGRLPDEVAKRLRRGERDRG